MKKVRVRRTKILTFILSMANSQSAGAMNPRNGPELTGFDLPRAVNSALYAMMPIGPMR